jgi:hypothetical protein
MEKLLIILSPPRSFSSVVSTMVGDIRSCTGSPSCTCSSATPSRRSSTWSTKSQRYASPPGLLRTLAQLHDGLQTTGTIVRAVQWLVERRDWSTKQLLDYLLERVRPKIGVEKSPITSLKPSWSAPSPSTTPRPITCT